MKKLFSHKISSFFNKAKDRLVNVVPKKQGAIFMVFALILTGSLILLQPAHALSAGDIGTSVVNILIGTIAQILLWLAQLFIKLTVFSLDFFIRLASYNGFIDAPVVIIGWTMIRDIANMFFVVVLLVIAFGTILGIEQYEWKKTLAKFIVAAILINFSRLIAGLIIDAAHVFTMTFVNAISATAGGNIINMLHLEKILSMSGTAGEGALGGTSDSADLRIDILIAAFMGAFFGFVSLMTIGAYMMIMVIRVIVLWVLIILSPLPYILGVLQKTKGYADEYWQEFANYVLVAPIAVFFLWLAFATLGSGDFAGPDLGLQFDSNKESQTAASIGLKDQKVGATGVSLSEVTSWENMANFILAVAFLWIGLERVQKTGVRGSELAGKVREYAKKGAYQATAKTAWHAPLGGKFWTRQGKTAFNRVKLGLQESKIRQAEGAAARDKKGLIGSSRFAETAIGKKISGTGADKFVGKYLVNRLGGELSGGLVGDSRARADKRAEDWEETVERQKKILDESYGTGSASEGGLRKTAMTARLQKKEAFIEQKKNQKVLQQRKKYEDLIQSAQAEVQLKVDAGEINKKDFEKEVEKTLGGMTIPFGIGEMAMEQKAAKSNLLGYYKDSKLEAATLAKKEVLEDDVKSRDTLRAAEARDVYEAGLKKKGTFEEDVLGAQRRKVEAAELTRLQDRDTRRRVGNEKAKMYEKSGDNVRANAVRANLAAEELEENKKMMDAFNHDEITQIVTSTTDEYKKAVSNGATPEELKQLQSQVMSSVISAFGQGASTGMPAFQNALKSLGFNEEITKENAPLAVASIFAGEVVGKKDNNGNFVGKDGKPLPADAPHPVESAMEQAKERFTHGEEYGEEIFNQLLRQFDNGTKALAADGELSLVGTIGASFDENQKKTTYSANSQRDESKAGWYADNLLDVRKTKDAAGIGTKDSEGKLVRFSNKQVDNMAKLFAGKNSNQIAQMPAAFWNSLGENNVNIKDEVGAKSMVKAITRAIEAAQPEAGKVMFDAMNKDGGILKVLSSGPYSQKTDIDVLEQLVNANSRRNSGNNPSTNPPVTP